MGFDRASASRSAKHDLLSEKLIERGNAIAAQGWWCPHSCSDTRPGAGESGSGQRRTRSRKTGGSWLYSPAPVYARVESPTNIHHQIQGPVRYGDGGFSSLVWPMVVERYSSPLCTFAQCRASQWQRAIYARASQVWTSGLAPDSRGLGQLGTGTRDRESQSRVMSLLDQDAGQAVARVHGQMPITLKAASFCLFLLFRPSAPSAFCPCR